VSSDVDLSVDVRRRLEVLERDECLQLLAGRHLGRLAVVAGGQPMVFPVNYALDGEHPVFRTDPGTKLHAASGAPVAFEIDGADMTYHSGWSVVVVGTCEEVRDAGEIARLARLPLRPWSAGPKEHWMRVRATAISGRRIPPAGDTADDELVL
jgi:nitroimidazol reductase NimA-like FMN-containing flavoprotein (pyridoxamine 5'-phosphate oxidase superfamily)